MNTPICDFVEKYANNDNLRFHMPGHKGVGTHGEAYDITEISGADSLYEASGIIAESEKHASEFYQADTFYSTEGSSLSIRAMMYLLTIHAREMGKKPVILAGRNAHKAFISAAAILDFDIEWLFATEGSYLSCKTSADDVERYLSNTESLPTAVYLTSPDYLGNMSDIERIAKLCHDRGILLAVDNAHGAYLNFLPTSMHPIALGADLCCDSAHKTLPALTGAAYLHISKNAPDAFSKMAKKALSLFGSTSPSYLILESLDRVNGYIANGYSDRLKVFIDSIHDLKRDLMAIGFDFIGDEPMKLTISTKKYGYTGTELAEYLVKNNVIPEFSDPDYLVLMLTPENGVEALHRIKSVLSDLPRKEAITITPPTMLPSSSVMSVREAILSPEETVPVDEALGRVLASVTVGCPPAVPIVVSGEAINESSIEAFKYYGFETCSVVKKQ